MIDAPTEGQIAQEIEQALTQTERRLLDMFKDENMQQDDEVTVQRMAVLWECKEDKARERLNRLCAEGKATARPGVSKSGKASKLYKIVSE